MTARIIDAMELFCLNSELRCGNNYVAGMARDTFRDIANKHPDMVVANVASHMARPLTVINFTPGGSAA